MKILAIGTIRLYQRLQPVWMFISKVTTGNEGTVCRFTPSCSEYTIEAIQKKGTLKGMRLGLVRLLKCHPWGKGGYDPVA